LLHQNTSVVSDNGTNDEDDPTSPAITQWSMTEGLREVVKVS